MIIEKLPALFNAESDDRSRAATLRIGEEGGMAVYTFTVMTPRLIRMGGSGDNAVGLFLDGRWETFTASGLSSRPDASVSVEILENNNKRSRYRIRIAVSGKVPQSLEAMAESLRFV